MARSSLHEGLIHLQDKAYWLMMPEIESQLGSADGEI